jgi:hypothetical protein
LIFKLVRLLAWGVPLLSSGCLLFLKWGPIIRPLWNPRCLGGWGSNNEGVRGYMLGPRYTERTLFTRGSEKGFLVPSESVPFYPEAAARIVWYLFSGKNAKSTSKPVLVEQLCSVGINCRQI